MMGRHKIAEVWLQLTACRDGRSLSVVISPHGRLRTGTERDSLFCTQVGTFDNRITLPDFEAAVREAEREAMAARSCDESALIATGMLG